MAQTVTVTPVAFSSYATNHADQFEFSNLSPYFGGTGSNYSDPRDAFGRATPNTAEPGSYVSSDFSGPGGTQEIGFNSLAGHHLGLRCLSSRAGRFARVQRDPAARRP